MNGSFLPPKYTKYVSILLAFILLSVMIVGCGDDTDDSENSSDTNDTSQTTDEQQDSEPIADNVLILPARAEDNSHEYYYELLRRALEAADSDLEVQLTEPLPQTRSTEMLERGELSIFWLLQTAERDEDFVPIEVGLTNGLIGNRIFLITPDTQELYNNVETLEDFRNLDLVGAFGANWFDASVWEANDLDYVEIEGDWQVIYTMLESGDRGIDYFSRGFTEINNDAAVYPDLDIESELVFVYDRDFIFYLTPQYAQYQEEIKNALEAARDSGLIDELVREYWSEDFEALDYDNRTVITLTTPE